MEFVDQTWTLASNKVDLNNRKFEMTDKKDGMMDNVGKKLDMIQ